ncbi:MAG: hypothetical protein ACOYNS_05080, partial [Bacteroidota bacterium]
MFFPHLMNIKDSDIVLEIGPGAYPFWRSDCLADVFDENSDVDLTQFGGKKLNTKGKPLFKIVNNILEFSKFESGNVEVKSDVFMLNGLIGEVKEIIYPLAREKGLIFNVRNTNKEVLIN